MEKTNLRLTKEILAELSLDEKKIKFSKKMLEIINLFYVKGYQQLLINFEITQRQYRLLSMEKQKHITKLKKRNKKREKNYFKAIEKNREKELLFN